MLTLKRKPFHIYTPEFFKLSKTSIEMSIEHDGLYPTLTLYKKGLMFNSNQDNLIRIYTTMDSKLATKKLLDKDTGKVKCICYSSGCLFVGLERSIRKYRYSDHFKHEEDIDEYLEENGLRDPTSIEHDSNTNNVYVSFRENDKVVCYGLKGKVLTEIIQPTQIRIDSVCNRLYTIGKSRTNTDLVYISNLYSLKIIDKIELNNCYNLVGLHIDNYGFLYTTANIANHKNSNKCLIIIDNLSYHSKSIELDNSNNILDFALQDYKLYAIKSCQLIEYKVF